MGADNVPGDADLLDTAMENILQMESVKKTPRLNMFVQLHAEGMVRQQHIGHGKLKKVDFSPTEATNGVALTSFVKWALDKVKHRKKDHSMLVLWGHSYLFGVGPQTIRNGIDALDFAELSTVLRRFQGEHREQHRKEYAGDETPRLDILAFDACDIATIEIACQLDRFADYLVASQIGIPLPGWPYDQVLGRIAEPKGDMMGPPELGTYIARRFCQHYAAEQRTVTMSVLDLKRARQLFGLVEALARRLAIAVNSIPDEMNVVHDMFLRSRTPDDRPFVDVASLCRELMRSSADPDVIVAAKALGDYLISPQPDLRLDDGGRTSEVGLHRPFILENCRNSAETAGLHGVSLYAPNVTEDDFAGATHFYEKFVFARETLWNGLVHELAVSD
jgi:hypothetical protein